MSNEEVISEISFVRGMFVYQLTKIRLPGCGVLFEARACPGNFESGLGYCAFEAIERVDARIQGRDIPEVPDRVVTRAALQARAADKQHPVSEVAEMALNNGPRSAEWLLFTWIQVGGQDG